MTLNYQSSNIKCIILKKYLLTYNIKTVHFQYLYKFNKNVSWTITDLQ